jgi:DMSO/TMAO reductase YedYZ molybdopterin-dependent catalytic subunit
MSPVGRVHRVPPAAHRLVEQPVLHVSGLAERQLDLTPEDLASLPRRELRENFSCDADRAAAGQCWRGVRVSDVVALAQPLGEACFVRVSSGGFVIPLALAKCEAALLSDSLNDEPLSIERGGPWRLVVPGGRCFTSVKWVNYLELAAESGRDTGELIEQARQRRLVLAEG